MALLSDHRATALRSWDLLVRHLRRAGYFQSGLQLVDEMVRWKAESGLSRWWWVAWNRVTWHRVAWK